MKLLAEISDRTLGLGSEELLFSRYELRKSARAILLNTDGAMAVQHLTKRGFHKLPGGGVDVGESVEDALVREVREEVGCACSVGDLVGVVVEYRNKASLLHISYCYTSTVEGEVGEPTYEQAELDDGQETMWLSPKEALAALEADNPEIYKARFILAREVAFVREYLSTSN